MYNFNIFLNANTANADVGGSAIALPVLCTGELIESYPEMKVESEKLLKKCNNCQNLVYCNLETICAVPLNGLTVHQVSTQSDENCYPETKCRRMDRRQRYTIITTIIWWGIIKFPWTNLEIDMKSFLSPTFRSFKKGRC